MIFTKADRASLELLHAKVDSLQGHMAGVVFVNMEKRLSQKLEALAESQVKLLEGIKALNGYQNNLTEQLKPWLRELSQSQGKLLARLDALDAGLHGTAMRDHQQLLAELNKLPDLKNVQMSPDTLDLWQNVDRKLSLLIQAKPPRKARKKARR